MVDDKKEEKPEDQVYSESMLVLIEWDKTFNGSDDNRVYSII